MHSRWKLALAVVTSPGAAFEEILDRKLVRDAAVIVILTGVLAAGSPLLSSLKLGPLQLALLGKSNPIVWTGLFLLYAAALWKLLKLIGTEIDYLRLVTVMGWAQVTLLVSQIALIAGNIAAFSPNPNATVVSITSTGNLAMMIWYVVAIAVGIRTATGAPTSRGVLGYVVVELMAVIAFAYTYGSTRFAPFAASLPGIRRLAGEVVASDQMPWLGAGAAGLALGLWLIGGALEWPRGARSRAAATGALVGVAALAVYAGLWTRAGYYDGLLKAQQLHNKADYPAAARQMEKLLWVSKNNADLMADIGGTYFAAGNDERALSYLKRALGAAATASRQEADILKSRVHSAIGAVYDMQQKYDIAIREFQKSAKLWPDYRDPWVRMAVTYNRMGDYDKAIESGNHAMKELGSDARVGWVALAQAFVRTGDKTQAGTAIAVATDRDEKLAARIGKKSEDWANAVDKLTRRDLRFPLEKEIARPRSGGQPERPKSNDTK